MSILDKIVATKQQELAALPAAEVTVDSLRAQVTARGGVRDFTTALANPRAGDVGLIAEVKKGVAFGRHHSAGFRSGPNRAGIRNGWRELSLSVDR